MRVDCNCSMYGGIAYVVKTQREWQRHEALKRRDIQQSALATATGTGARQNFSLAMPVDSLPVHQDTDVPSRSPSSVQSLPTCSPPGSDNYDAPSPVIDAPLEYSDPLPVHSDALSPLSDNSADAYGDVSSSIASCSPPHVGQPSEFIDFRNDKDVDTSHYDEPWVVSQYQTPNSPPRELRGLATGLLSIDIGGSSPPYEYSSSLQSVEDSDQLISDGSISNSDRSGPVGQMSRGLVFQDEDVDESNTESERTSISGGEESSDAEHDTEAPFDFTNPLQKAPSNQEMLSFALHDIVLKHKIAREAANDISALFSSIMEDENLLDYRTSRRRIERMTGIKEILYDCCPLSHMSYAMYPDLEECITCKHPRWMPSTKRPYASHGYIPITHRLQLLYSDPHTARLMTSYRHMAETERQKGRRVDFWSSDLYQEKKCYFPNDTDIALLLSTDGVRVFKSRRNFSIWPIMLMNLNIPPQHRAKKRFMLMVGFIPGPNNPKDLDSFLFPLVKELKELENGIPYVWNGARKNYFTLRAHICIVTADMPGREKLLNFKGNRGTSYCPYCYAHGVHNRGIYCPLKPPLNPPSTVKREIISTWTSYDASNLPLRSDSDCRKIANHVIETGDDKTAKKYGIKGPSCLSELLTIDIPRSFPPDAMHLWWENVIPDLFRHWRGKFSSGTPIDDGVVQEQGPIYDADSESENSQENPGSRRRRSTRRKSNTAPPVLKGVSAEAKKFVRTKDPYNISPEDWLRIGKDMATSAGTFPASFGEPIRNFADHCQHLKAAEWKNIALLMAPIYMKDRLPEADYLEFLNLIDAVHLCIDISITDMEILVIEQRLKRFVEYYENRYYGRAWERLSACLPVMHQVLHVADSIRSLGPMGVYSQWPMERVCGMIAASAKSRVSTNRNMGLTMLLNEQRNFLPYVLPQSLFGDISEVEDTDGAVLLHRLFAKRLVSKTPLSLPTPALSKENRRSAGGFAPPKKQKALNRWQREALQTYLFEKYDTTIPYQLVPKECIMWKSFTSQTAWGLKFTAVSSQLKRINSTRSSSMVRYEATLDMTLYSGYCEILFFFSVSREDMNLLMNQLNLINDDDRDNVPLNFAYIEPIEVEMEDRLLRKIGVGSKAVIEVVNIQQLIGLIKSCNKEYIVSQTTCLW